VPNSVLCVLRSFTLFRMYSCHRMSSYFIHLMDVVFEMLYIQQLPPPTPRPEWVVDVLRFFVTRGVEN
jgi:hypothetical protein